MSLVSTHICYCRRNHLRIRFLFSFQTRKESEIDRIWEVFMHNIKMRIEKKKKDVKRCLNAFLEFQYTREMCAHKKNLSTYILYVSWKHH